jgi:hypothetical protein
MADLHVSNSSVCTYAVWWCTGLRKYIKYGATMFLYMYMLAGTTVIIDFLILSIADSTEKQFLSW